MADRALELLALPQDGAPRLILDLGCGSGLSGNVIGAAGHYWVGMDISGHMLGIEFSQVLTCFVEVARKRMKGEEAEGEETEEGGPSKPMNIDAEYDNEESSLSSESLESLESSDDQEDIGDSDPNLCADLFHHDMGDGTCFRPGIFDGCISVSALQWLCHSNRATENPKTRLSRLFTSLFGCLSRGARAVFQFYPETSKQTDLILGCAMKAGFTGGLVIDYPNSTKAKKYYLCLMTGPATHLPQALEGENDEHHVGVDKRSRKRQREAHSKRRLHDKKWVLEKKELARKRGQEVKSDSKYTARRRRVKF